MLKKRVLIFPNTNTLSHFTRALVCAEWLEEEGCETHIGLSQSRRLWASRYHPRCYEICELWEPSRIPFPCLNWFSNLNHIEGCVRSQEALINLVRPDLIIAVFDFVSFLTARSIPRISINGACMLPIYQGVLGFDDTDSADRREQQRILENFWFFGARAFGQSFVNRNLEPVDRANKLLVGDVNLIYEIEDICGMTELPDNYHYIGPLLWEGWDEIGERIPWDRNGKLTIYFNAGTLMKNEKIMAEVTKDCKDTGARLLVSSGMEGPAETDDNMFCKPFLSPADAMALCDISICTGGVGACYTNLIHAVPSLVIPMQPEQATNGLNLAKTGCGTVLNNNITYVGNPWQYENAFDRSRFRTALEQIISNNHSAHLENISRKLKSLSTRRNLIEIVRKSI